MQRRIKIVLLINLLVVYPFAYSQPGQTSSILKFEHITDGLSQNTVTCSFEDSYGFMWFGTQNGLNRYDGVDFINYVPVLNDSTAISDGQIECIFEDKDRRLWIGTRAGGLNLYNRERDHFTHFINQDKLPGSYSISDNHVMAIFEDSQNNLWIGTARGGLNLMDREKKIFIHYKHQAFDKSSLSNNFVNGITEYKETGKLWISTRFDGLNLFDPETKKFKHYRHNPDDNTSLSSDEIRALFKSSNGQLWLGTQSGLSQMYYNQLGQVKFKRFVHNPNNPNSLIYNFVFSLGEDDEGRIWIGTENGGLSIYDPKNDSFSHLLYDPKNSSSLGSNSVWSIYKDSKGTMWLGPLNSGINKLDENDKKFIPYGVNPFMSTTLSHKNVTCFLEEENGDLWIGTDGGGLNYYNKKTGSYTHYRYDVNNPRSIGSDAILCLLKDELGRLWIGTWEGGVNLFNPMSKTFTRYIHNSTNSASISTNNVYSMIIDKQHRFWVGATGGALELFDPDKGTFKHFIDDTNIDYNLIFVVHEDENGGIWVGTDNGGLSKLIWNKDGQYSFKHYLHKKHYPKSISNNSILSILNDGRGNFWIGTQGGGLNLFNIQTEEFKSFSHLDGLPNDVVNGILDDDQGHLWLSTNNGLSRFSLDKLTFRNYDKSDGLQSNEYIRCSYYKNNDGELFFGGVNGFNRFHPTLITENKFIPPIQLTDFKIHNKSVTVDQEGSPLTEHINDTKEISLSYNQANFSINYVVLNYSQATKNKYAYKLEGYDNDWQYVGDERKADYTKVPTGKYTFLVKGSNNDGFWNESPASLIIIVKSAWWATGWAYVLYTFILLVILLWARQSIINQERLKSDLKVEHLELIKMKEVIVMRSRFFANIAHEFRTPLTLITDPLRALYNSQLLGDSKNQFRMMLRNTHKLLHLTNQLLDLSKIGTGNMKLQASKQDVTSYLLPLVSSFNSYANKHRMDYQYDKPTNPIYAYVDTEKLENILSNLLSNAFKFTPEYGQIILTLKVVERATVRDPTINRYIEIAIRDTGIGIAEAELENIFERFYQVGSTAGVHKGTGVGLALTKELVELHKGYITVKSVEGEGSEFCVFLPLGSEHLDEHEILKTFEALEFKDYERSEFLAFTDSADFASAVEKAYTEDDTRLPLVLIVEDDTDMRHYITEHLETKFRVAEAPDGIEGFNLATALVPDLIISDIIMPKMSGIELCKKIKSDERTSHIPVLLLTAKSETEDTIQGFELGADYYLTKPFNSKLLELRIKNIIQSRERLRNYFRDGKVFNLEPNNIQQVSGDEKFLKQALGIVENNMSDSDFNVIYFGKELGLSRMQLYRKLKALTGQSANEFIRTIRLKRAAQLLEQQVMTIAEITYEVGFSDLQYFRECFKKQFGVNPSIYTKEFHRPTELG